MLFVIMSTAIDSDTYTSIQHMCMCACRVLPSVCPKRKTMKVGSRVNPSSLMVHVGKRLRTTADGTEAPLSAAEGILAGLNNRASMLSSVGTREGIDELLAKISVLTAAIQMGRRWSGATACVFFRRMSPMWCSTVYIYVCEACL